MRSSVLLVLFALTSVIAACRTPPPPECGTGGLIFVEGMGCVCPMGTRFVCDESTEVCVCEALDGGLPTDASPCVPTAETCNGIDDDCDTVIDGPAASAACGTREHASSMACTAGECVVTECIDGFGDCDEAAENGCEEPLDTLSNCGTCGNTCGWECEAGDCDDAIGMDAGFQYVCVVRDSGRVACVGSNSYGQLGNGEAGAGADRTSWVYVQDAAGAAPLRGVIEVSAGRSHACARDEGGGVWCWGRNDFGQLGDGTTTNRSVATRVAGVSGAVSVAAGERQSCAALGDGTVRCWGSNLAGELGVGDFMPRTGPSAVLGLDDATTVRSDGQATCALRADQRVECWGLNASGQIGDGSGENATRPSPVLGLGPVRDVSVERRYACAIELDDEVWCWGANDGQLGSLLGIDTFLSPQEVSLPFAVSRVCSGLWFIAADGRVLEADAPRDPLRAVEIADGFTVTCARSAAGGVSCRVGTATTFSPSPPP